MDSLLSKVSDLFDCESDDDDDVVSAPVHEWCGKSKPESKKVLNQDVCIPIASLTISATGAIIPRI